MEQEINIVKKELVDKNKEYISPKDAEFRFDISISKMPSQLPSRSKGYCVFFKNIKFEDIPHLIFKVERSLDNVR